jgi:hypothetical protein
MKKFFFSIFFMPLMAFSQNFENLIQNYLTQNKDKHNITAIDANDFVIHNKHYAKSTKTHNVYVTQRVSGIEIFHAVSVFAIDQNQNVRVAKVDFIKNVAQKINSTNVVLSPKQAISKAADYLNIDNRQELYILENNHPQHFIFNDANISQENIPVKLMFQPNDDKSELRLVWDLSIYLLDSSHWYSMRIDAITGKLLSILDWVNECKFDKHHAIDHYQIQAKTFGKQISLNKSNVAFTPNDGSQYNVLAMPNESPNHGNITLLNQPADALASPFGWHDTNGVVGPEFTTTRGNNVRARADLAGNNTGDEANGGTNLNFNFPFNFSGNPSTYVNASTTNLFYWNNVIHDAFHHYGFDEASGNFQETNYSGQGLGNDAVNADDQDGSGTNNANFATPPDGNRPRMQMYNWTTGASAAVLSIPSGSQSGSYPIVPSTFGGDLSTPVTGDLVLISDDNSGTSTDSNDGCDNITNGSSLVGKIVVINRGNCQFGTKVLAAENQGAIAVIVVNNVNTAPIAMGPGNDGGTVTIPSVMINQSQGLALVTALQNNTPISGTLTLSGSPVFTSSLDSGVITHEYGHGISNRLTGGANLSGCLQNAEQMGEGWSDYFSLMLTMKPTDTANQIRGVGTYLINQPTNGNGIRPAPYSRNFAVNEFTFGDTNNSGVSQPHGIGFVWASMLWDMTWDLIDVYGFDSNLYSGSGGNNIALQLVVDGLKLQPCSPGFVDGRNAILEADLLANNNENKCLIWRAFARRGLGVGANQGNTNDRFDQVEAFDIPEECALSTNGFDSGNFFMYPNPTDGQLQIVAKQAVNNCVIAVYDINGRLVQKQTTDLTNYNVLNIENLDAGVYIIRLIGEDVDYQTKIIKK